MSRRSTSNLPKPNPPNGISISKLDAAKRQLDTAIQLWFEDRDPVSIHTLVSAVMVILEPLAKKNGTWKGVFDTSIVRPGLEEEYLALIKLPQNFFKYGSKDSSESILFNPESNVLGVFSALEVYRQIAPKGITSLMKAFQARFWLSHREYFVNRASPVSPVMESSLLLLSKRDFLVRVLEGPV